MNTRNTKSGANGSRNACLLDEESNCTTSPAHDYVWFVKRIGRKLRSLAAR